jgi:putative ABC transport system permease protein
MEIPLVEGRTFDESDAAGSPPVVVLTRTAAARIYPDERAVGRQLAVDSRDGPMYFEVVGVVEDHKLGSLAGASRPAMFYPYAQRPTSAMSLAIGTTTNPVTLIRPVQARIWELDRDIVLSDAQSVEAALSESVAGTRSITTVLGLFAAVALGLASLGLYGVLAFFVSKRIHEIGIRVALGASGKQVLRLVLARGLTLVGVGLVLGTAGAFGATRMMEGMLFQISAQDPITFVGVTGFFVLVALGACLIPAWRALRVDPVEVLRLE